MVEPFCLDEGRSLYRVEYSVATAIIRIILISVSVVLVLLYLFPLDFCIYTVYLFLNLINKCL